MIVDPNDYESILSEIRDKGGELSDETRFRLVCKAFQHTAHYDGMISNYLDSLNGNKEPSPWGRTLNLQFTKIQDLRYGENPHQHAAFYSSGEGPGTSIARAKQIQGKELSFNNILDADSALGTVLEFSETAAVAIKHTNPCGAAVSKISLADAFRKARASDPVSIFETGAL